jgi:hypothetical protein
VLEIATGYWRLANGATARASIKILIPREIWLFDLDKILPGLHVQLSQPPVASRQPQY